MHLFSHFFSLWAAVLIIAAITLAALGVLFISAVMIFYTKKYPVASLKKKYAFFIAAKNEENVIGTLIKSIRAMDYPQENVTIFVLANNCSETDKTAKIAKDLGEEVFELHDSSITNVGQVLERFFIYIKKQFNGYDAFDGYIRLDADNIVQRDFLSKMNDAHCANEDGAIVAYRANQNFNGGVRASLTCMLVSQAMMAFSLLSMFKANVVITGPGVLLTPTILDKIGGWPCKTLSEDVEMSTLLTGQKIKIHYAKEAVFFDEQVETFKMIFRQRLRWSKGKGQVFKKYWGEMIKDSFPLIKPSSFIMVLGLFPFGVFVSSIFLALVITGTVLSILTLSHMPFIFFFVIPLGGVLALMWYLALLTLIAERKYQRANFFKKIIYFIVFPLSYWLSYIIDVLRIFIRVKWKPIQHGKGGNDKKEDD